MRRNGRIVHLIDTPGFDDTTRSDAEILQELSYWLITAYELDLYLSGVICLHRITDSRLQGSALRGLHVFKEICGWENFSMLTMATTRWDEVDRDVGISRHKQLKSNPQFWGDIVAAGGSVTRVEPGQHSALAIIDHIVRRDRRMVLKLQHELVDDRIRLGETEAGKIVYASILDDIERDENQIAFLRLELSAAIAERRESDRRDFQETLREYEHRLEKRKIARNQARETLRPKSGDLSRIWEPRLREDYRKLKERVKANQEQLRRLEIERSRSSLGTRAWDEQNAERVEAAQRERQDLKQTEASHLGGRLVKEVGKGIISGLAGVAVTAAVGAIACSVM